ncbi:MAG TPA: VOC family protein [Gaiellaceae bacterium]|jgi:catechol 2,3-dioxygenase-like lactoylglutathione lyase family enzyme|nr:VOC family protein [Gaiellaceae bacterium]
MIESIHSHVCLAVSDLERAQVDLGASLGLTWAAVRMVDTGAGEIRLTYSRQGPPFLELVEGAPGSLWDPGVSTPPHHTGYWSDDVEADSARLRAEGMEVVLDGTAHGRRFVYLRSRHGLTIELTDVQRRPAILAWIAGEPG